MTNEIHSRVQWVRGDVIIIVLAAVVLTAASWAYLVHDVRSGHLGVPACCELPDPRTWGVRELSILMIMWTVMMVGMMTPTVLPIMLMVAALARQRKAAGRPYAGAFYFLTGYLIIWTAFSFIATLLQWGLHRVAWVSPEMTAGNRWFAGAVLIAAGVFQFTPMKNRCLTCCQSPIDFLMTRWREGRMGAIKMGLENGLLCAGCCWLLMLLLFVVGVMNLLWIAIISVFVLLEKVSHKLPWIGQGAAIGLITWGIYVMSRATT